jgi:uncharacterized protein (DUF2236 family)
MRNVEEAPMSTPISSAISSRLERYRQTLVQQIEEAGGRHDEPSMYGGEPGDLGLCGGPGSMSWEINGDFASVAIAGMGAILMEVLHPSVMAGVYTQSSYRTEPLRRARNTLGYVLRTTFGNTKAATGVIEAVKHVHSRINGVRTDGMPYRALDPELIAWVHTSIPMGIMNAYDKYKRPLTVEEKNRYLKEQAVIGRMGGADWVPESVAELADYLEKMRPLMAFNEQTRDFLDFLYGRVEGAGLKRMELLDRWAGVQSSMSLMPEWGRRLTGTYRPEWMCKLWLWPNERLKARMMRWVYPEMPCKTMAMARAKGIPPVRSAVAAA